MPADIATVPQNHLAHLVIDCPGPKPLIEPPCHEFGPNFRLLGLFEHPVAVGKHRTSYMPILEENDSPFLPDADRSEVWTDGSVYFTSNFWLTVAGYSIVSAQGEVLEADRISLPEFVILRGRALCCNTSFCFSINKYIYLYGLQVNC